MIDIRTFQCNPLQENCFIVSDESGEAVVVDCGALFDEERKAVTQHLRNNALKLRHVLCTHAHFDHIFGLDTLYREFGARPRLHDADSLLYMKMNDQVADMLGTRLDFDMPPLGDSLNDGDEIGFGTHTIRVIHTPGHSPGSVLLYIESEKVLFAGDTIFRMSVGRTDLEGGSWQLLMGSLQRVARDVADDVTVYCGHGPRTVIGEEKRMNPYFRAKTNYI
jgi:glyoxylase-like metal-dependent hydrolase (beta-lactamase superfamily II)